MQCDVKTVPDSFPPVPDRSRPPLLLGYPKTAPPTVPDSVLTKFIEGRLSYLIQYFYKLISCRSKFDWYLFVF